MPVEIRQLIIRASVEESGSEGPGAAAKPGAPSPEKLAESPKPGAGGRDQSALVNECVDQVMEILREQQER